MWAMSITGHSISQWLPCPVPSWVPNTIGTWGGNSVKFSSVKLNGTERYFKCSMVYRSLSFLPFKVPLRPTNLPLMSSMVLNGTERY